MEVENYTVVQYGKESLTYTSGEEFYTTPSRANKFFKILIKILIITGTLATIACKFFNVLELKF